MSEQAEFLLDDCGYYEASQYCELHPNEWWPESDEYGCPQCLAEAEFEDV